MQCGVGSILVKVIGTGLSFLLGVVLARSLGTEGYGAYSFAFSLLMFLTIPIHAGLPNLAVRETARALLHHDWALIRGLWRWISRFSIGYFFFLCTLLLIISGVKLNWSHSERYRVIVAGFVLIPLIALVLSQGGIIRGLGRVVMGIIPDTLIRPGMTLILLCFALSFLPIGLLTPHLAMLMYVASVAVAFLVSLIMLRVLVPKVNGHRTEAETWRCAAYRLTVVGGLQLMYGYTDIIILGLFHSDVEVGVYRAARQLVMLVTFGLSAINPILHPHFSRLFAQNQMAKLQKLTTASSLVILLFAVLPALPFLLGGKFVLQTIFGETYAAGTVALAILAIGQLANAAFGSVGALLNMTGHEKDAMKGMLYSVGLNIALAFLLIPLYGIEGAALASALSVIAWNTILRHYVKIRLDIESIGLLCKKFI